MRNFWTKRRFSVVDFIVYVIVVLVVARLITGGM